MAVQPLFFTSYGPIYVFGCGSVGWVEGPTGSPVLYAISGPETQRTAGSTITPFSPPIFAAK